MATVPSNFLALEREYCRYETSRFVFLPIPYDATTTYLAGTRYGPESIIRASAHLEDYDDELDYEFHTAGVCTLDPIDPESAGPEAMHNRIYEVAQKLVADGKFVFALGGEHGITSALVRAAMDVAKPISVLQIDAHCDLYDGYQGAKYSHASVMRRVVEMGASIVPVGIRCMASEEHDFIVSKGINPILATRCHASGDWIDEALNRLGDSVYVSIDIDGFDPAYAPGTGTPVPGGLDWYQVTELLRRVAAEKQVVGADLVEVMPIPGQAVTESLAAKLAYRLIGYIVASERKRR